MTAVTPGREDIRIESSSTEKRIEMVKLLSLLKVDDEKPGDVVLRGLRGLATAADANTTLRFELEAARNELEIADGEIARLAAKPADEGVRELKQRIHNMRVTLSSVVTLAESGPVNLKTQNAIAKAAKHSLDRDASTTGAPKP